MSNTKSQNENQFKAVWNDNFYREVKNIQIQYDAFFLDRNLEDFFSLQWHEKETMLSLHFHDIHAMPKAIVEALELAFIKARPSN